MADVRGIVVGSRNAAVGFPAAIRVLREGGSAVDAAIAAVKAVEDDLRDQGVGTGGIPNILGEVELDASIMDGRTLAAGAVGALKHFPHPIEIARRVMECTPHVLLVGDGADLFARTHGFSPANLLTPEAEAIWRAVVTGERSPEQNVYEDRYQLYMSVVRRWVELLHPERFGTTNVIVRDLEGNIACAVSTSGWGFKWPGRLGDSPIIGAGNYADNRYGAAACTGRGEMAIRCATAHSVVMFLRFGLPLEEALRQAMLDLRRLDDPYAEAETVMNIVAMDRYGNVAAASTSPQATYVVQTVEMETYEERPRLHVPLRE
ncbi:MAG: N(4)-(beta-N-acetylglucosaminyl)-L-asparaginase [Thermomicrobium sp.]|nr:N(4)-(beta-N-acetylglucosaminyl)-L-asparaginase [Thermomicrobium sp.]MDW8060817.1 N(4)-(beta-N-acetylglucosaminyl)-L-asparaginase [Thermomicrobium sp.]